MFVLPVGVLSHLSVSKHKPGPCYELPDYREVVFAVKLDGQSVIFANREHEGTWEFAKRVLKKSLP